MEQAAGKQRKRHWQGEFVERWKWRRAARTNKNSVTGKNTMEIFIVWLKTSTLGIIALGAVGSIVSYILIKLIRSPATFVLEWSRKKLRIKYYEQHFLLGACAGHISKDTSGTLIVSLFMYRIARFCVALFVCSTSILVLTILIATQHETIATYATVASTTLIFLSGYWLSYEYEWINRTYLWQWGQAMSTARNSYREQREELVKTNVGNPGE